MQMVPVNFNQLYYFWVVAKTGSISAAAKRLLLDQSTVSLQMKQLESSLGKRLLSRSRHGTSLTDAGKVVFEHCESMFMRAEALMASLRSDLPSSAPVFRLGVSQTVSRDKILGVTRYIKKLDPSISVTILSRSSEELETRLERRQLDLVVSDMDLSVRLGKEFRSRLTSNTRLFFVASPELRTKMGAFPSGLFRIPLLLRAPENPVRKEVDYFLHRRGIIPNVRAEVENPDLIRIMATQGEGAAITDLMSVRQELRQRRLVRLHPRPIGIRECVWFISRRSRIFQPALQNAVDLLMNRFRFGRFSSA
jgi:LysR family transcriptional activator of nhaA